MRTLNVDTAVARVRRLTNLETSNQARSIVTDAEVLEHLNDGYRRVWDIAVEVAPSFLAKRASLATPYTLPTDYLGALAVDYVVGDETRALRPYQLAERDIYQHASSDWPYWHANLYGAAGARLFFQPTTFAGTVTLHYVPLAATLAAAGTYLAGNAWEEYIVRSAQCAVLEKQEYDTLAAERRLEDAERRVRRALRAVENVPGPVVDLTARSDAWYRGS